MQGPDLSGSVAVVTGGGSGIGAACARLLVARDCRVVIADVDAGRARDVATELGNEVLPVTVEVTDSESVERMVAAAVGRFGRLDIAINSAGVGMGGRAAVAEVSWEQWRRILGVNLDGTFLSMRAEVTAMARTGGGSVVNIASVMGLVSSVGTSPYVASKHGVIGLTRAAALDYADQAIRVNAVAPAYIQTPMIGWRSDAAMTALAQAHPIGRLGLAEEVAQVACFLAGPAASFVTGAVYTADGGFTTR